MLLPGKDKVTRLGPRCMPTSIRRALDRLDPSRWLMMRPQWERLPSPWITSREEVLAGNLKVTFFCKEAHDKCKTDVISRRSKLVAVAILQAILHDTTVLMLYAIWQSKQGKPQQAWNTDQEQYGTQSRVSSLYQFSYIIYKHYQTYGHPLKLPETGSLGLLHTSFCKPMKRLFCQTHEGGWRCRWLSEEREQTHG